MSEVISYGGSIIAPEKIDISFIKKVVRILSEKKEKMFVVVGGGVIARNYIARARELKGNEYLLDEIGILATRINAHLLLCALNDLNVDVYPKIAETIDEAITAKNGMVVMGGTVPGHTTDAVSALLAERADARKLLIATSVEGVYTADPKKDNKARKIDLLTPEQLIGIVMKNRSIAGSISVIDLLASRIIERSNIECWIFDGRNLEDLKRGLENKREGFNGTIVTVKSS
jgi:uridylate kinase, putative